MVDVLMWWIRWIRRVQHHGVVSIWVAVWAMKSDLRGSFNGVKARRLEADTA
jgi:hypothetical protein